MRRGEHFWYLPAHFSNRKIIYSQLSKRLKQSSNPGRECEGRSLAEGGGGLSFRIPESSTAEPFSSLCHCINWSPNIAIARVVSPQTKGVPSLPIFRYRFLIVIGFERMHHYSHKFFFFSEFSFGQQLSRHHKLQHFKFNVHTTLL